MTAAKSTYWANQAEIQRLAVAGWIARAEGQNDEALALLRRAADAEGATEKHPVTPGSIQPAREMLGELLLELNQPAQALVEFDSVETAKKVKHALNGADIYSGCCTLKVEFAKVRIATIGVRIRIGFD